MSKTDNWPFRLVIVDADDTLWPNAETYRALVDSTMDDTVANLRRPWASPETLRARFRMSLNAALERERPWRGWGMRSLALALIEVVSAMAEEAGGLTKPGVVSRLLERMNADLRRPIGTFDGVAAALQELQRRGPVQVLTKGCPVEQGAKWNQTPFDNGIGFACVPEKDVNVYRTLALTKGLPASDILVIGNGWHSDVRVPVTAGCCAAWVPRPPAVQALLPAPERGPHHEGGMVLPPDEDAVEDLPWERIVIKESLADVLDHDWRWNGGDSG